jgi:hypothetical protein
MGTGRRTLGALLPGAMLLSVAGITLVAPALGHPGPAGGAGELVVESKRSGATTVAGSEADGPKFFKLELTVTGNFVANYGPPPDQNTSDYSGFAKTSYSSELVSVARYRGGEEIHGDLNNTKGRIVEREESSVVSHFPGSEPTYFGCDNGQSAQATGTDNPFLLAVFKRDIGEIRISGAPGEPKEVDFKVLDGRHFDAECFDSGHEPVNHYLISPDDGSVLLKDTSTIAPCCVIPRGAFNSESDRKYGATYTRNVSFDDGPNPHPGEFPIHIGPDYNHEFTGSSSASFEIKQVSERKFNRVQRRIQNLGRAD